MQLSLKETIIKLSNLTTQPKENESACIVCIKCMIKSLHMYIMYACICVCVCVCATLQALWQEESILTMYGIVFSGT